MIIYAVDDERAPLKLLSEAIAEAEPHATVELFNHPMKLLERAEERPCDVAFLDIMMAGVDGIFLARKLTEMSLAKNIIFVTSYTEYALDALNMYASAYLLKPASAEDVREALKHLRVPVVTEAARIKVRTFGGFEVTVGGEPVKFKRKKSLEVLAYLIDRRGEPTYDEELVTDLWDGEAFDESRIKYLRILISDMKKDLKKAGAEDMLDCIGPIPAVRTETFWCDAYEALNENAEMLRRFKGNYLPQFAWSELTNAQLCHLADIC